MSFFEDIATPLIARNLPVIPLRARTKIALLKDWPALATRDINVVKEWGSQYPDANCAVVAEGKVGGYFFLEVDDPLTPSRIETETGQAIPKTFRIRSSPGRGHYVFRTTPEILTIGNIPQNFVKNRDFSLRVDRSY